jgi:hypothetical protein
VLQLECPDLALSRHTVFAHLPLEAFLKVIEMHVEALNYAVKEVASQILSDDAERLAGQGIMLPKE